MPLTGGAPDLLESLSDGIATLTINRPARRNALDATTLDILLSRLEALSKDDAVAVVILTGAESDAFCAGGDVTHMDDIAEKPFEERLGNLQRWGGISVLLRTMPKITIAMVNGVAAGAGFALAAACDFRIAASTARFATAYAKIGRSGDFGSSALITRLLGGARARELCLAGDVIDAQTARQYGLVYLIFEPAMLQRETINFARRFSEGPRIALAYIKQNLLAAETMTFSEMMAMEAYHHAITGTTAEHREALAAFKEKRKRAFR